METVIVVVPGLVAIHELADCLAVSLDVSGVSPLVINAAKGHAFVRVIDDPIGDAVFDGHWYAIVCPPVNTVFAVDYRDQSLPVAIVDSIVATHACFVDTNFGEVITGKAFIDRFRVETLGWPN